MKLGFNDVFGNVYCSLCDWVYACQSYEELEHRLKEHLQDAHGLTLKYAIEGDTGKLKEVPR